MERGAKILIKTCAGVRADEHVVIVTDAEHLEPYERFGQVLSLPGSYGALRRACEEVAQTFPKMAPVEMAATVSGSSSDVEA